jgi:hypothetical protein
MKRLFLLALLGIHLRVSAQIIDLPTDYSPVTINATANSTTLLAQSNGSLSSAYFLRLEGPEGVAASLDVIQGSKEVALRNLNSSKGWFSVAVARGRIARSISALPLATSNFTKNGASLCSQLSESDISSLARDFTAAYGGVWDRARICAWLQNELGNFPPSVGGSGEEEIPFGVDVGDIPRDGPIPDQPINGSDPFYGSGLIKYSESFGVIQKDACNPRINTYTLRVRVDTSGVDRASFPNGVPVRVQLFNKTYSGPKASSIKPESDGKFAPKPLILMSTLGFNETINVVQWGGGTPSRITKIPVDSFDRVFWQGQVLARAPIDGILSASSRKQPKRRAPRGRARRLRAAPASNEATFEISTPNQAYGVCFQLVRSRQKANGYP